MQDNEPSLRITGDKGPLRVLTLNVHKGLSSLNRRLVIGELREAIRAAHPQIVFLQEVVGENRRHADRFDDWPLLPQYAYLAEERWSDFAYGGHSEYLAGHHGNALLSEFPILSHETVKISARSIEQCGFLYARVTLPGGALHCICVHLGLLRRWRSEQIAAIAAFVAGRIPPDEPLIVAGDFNDWSSKCDQQLAAPLGLVEAFVEKTGRHARSYPAALPLLRMDRIYCRGFSVIGAQVLSSARWRQLSDHAALYAELKRTYGTCSAPGQST